MKRLSIDYGRPMAGLTRRQPRRRLWQRIRRLLGLHPEPPSLLPPFDPPDDGESLVPAGPPRGPRPAGAVALDLPKAPVDVDARGRSTD